MMVIKLVTMNIFIVKELTSSLMASMGNHEDWKTTFEL